jgi:hypothetical protein
LSKSADRRDRGVTPCQMLYFIIGTWRPTRANINVLISCLRRSRRPVMKSGFTAGPSPTSSGTEPVAIPQQRTKPTRLLFIEPCWNRAGVIITPGNSWTGHWSANTATWNLKPMDGVIRPRSRFFQASIMSATALAMRTSNSVHGGLTMLRTTSRTTNLSRYAVESLHTMNEGKRVKKTWVDLAVTPPRPVPIPARSCARCP